ncbi:hypothetical protein ACP4OV_023232 [Aristida adscensionis]
MPRRMATSTRTAAAVPEVALQSGNARPMPAIGMGTSAFPPVHEATRDAVLAAVEVGFRHFDTASMYNTERPPGDAVAEALRRGLLASREEVFITSKLWCTQCHADLVLPSLRETLQNLQMKYLDLYLIHWPISVKSSGPLKFPNKREDAVPFDFKGVWQAMEECQRLGLARAIGVSNFTAKGPFVFFGWGNRTGAKHLDKILDIATNPPAVNQVEFNPVWQQRTLRGYCAEKGIHVAAYSPLGGQNWDGKGNAVMESEVLAKIAKERGKTVAQVSLRWIYEQGVTFIVKSYKKERLRQNLEILDWELTEEDRLKISQIPQKKTAKAVRLFSPDGEFKSVNLKDMEIVEE